jgi:N-acetyl sugar amidotransferase
MDTSDPDITFDAEGHCNHCTDYETRLRNLTYSGEVSEARLEAVVDRMRRAGRGRDYDCVMGISGGVDSCYAAHVLKGLGLRPLAVHLDNGWNSDTAVKNIKNVAHRLGIDYQSWVLDWEEFRDLQLAFLRASVPEIETPTDMAIPGALHRIASSHGVRYVVSGGNYATEGILPAAWHYNAKDLKFLKAVHRRFGTRGLESFPTFGYLDESWYKLVRGIRIIYLLNFVPYSKTAALEVLQRELGWQDYGGKHYESRITGFLHSYVLPVKFGIDYRRATLSTQICAGEATRAQALDVLATPPYREGGLSREKEFVAKKFEITVDELEAILREPPRTHRDYPNDQTRLEFIYAVYRRFFGT